MDTVCEKCGSTEIVSGVRIASGVDRFSSVPIAAVVYREPDALLLKQPVTFPISARICGECGHVEFCVEDPKAFFELAKATSVTAES